MTTNGGEAGFGHVDGLVRVLSRSQERAPDAWSYISKGCEERMGPGAIMIADRRGLISLVHAPEGLVAKGPLLWVRVGCADASGHFDLLNRARLRSGRVRASFITVGLAVLVAVSLWAAYAASILTFAVLILAPFSLFFALIAYWENAQREREGKHVLKHTILEFWTPRAVCSHNGWSVAKED